MTYTIEQINKAWIEFNQPKYLMTKGSKLLENKFGSIIEYDESKPTLIYRTDFISFLISYYSDKKSKKDQYRELEEELRERPKTSIMDDINYANKRINEIKK